MIDARYEKHRFEIRNLLLTINAQKDTIERQREDLRELNEVNHILRSKIDSIRMHVASMSTGWSNDDPCCTCRADATEPDRNCIKHGGA